MQGDAKMHRSAITETRLKNWIKAGRGDGFFAAYKPWIQVTRQDHGSHGYSHQTPSPFTGRPHHFLSNLEKNGFRTAMAHPGVIDAREQFPIWPASHPSPLELLHQHLGETKETDSISTVAGSLEIARNLHIKHETFVGIGHPYIYTTDLLLTVRLPRRSSKLVAIAFKTSAELRGGKKDEGPPKKATRIKRRKSVFRKLRLERAYWRNQGIPWVLVTEKQLNPNVISNLEFGHSSWQQYAPNEFQLQCLPKLRAQLRRSRVDQTCCHLLQAFSTKTGISFEETVRLFKLGLIIGGLPIDLGQQISLAGPIPWLSRDSSDAPHWSPFRKIWGEL